MILTGMIQQGGITISPPPPPPGPTLQGSLSFNGTSQYLGMSPGFALGTGAFTIEGWFYNNTDFTSRPLVATDQTYGLSLYTSDDYNITLDRYGGAGSVSYSWSPGTFQTNKWMYFILNRNPSGLETMYVGVQSSPGAAVTCNRASFAAGNFDPNDYTAGTCIDSYDWSGVCNRIGTYYGGYFPGYITNFRATIGDAKYDTNNSTVSAPSIELTSDAYTRYLMLGAAITTDSSGTQTVTNNNGVTQIATKPF